jgi:hypothetical protein
MIEDVAGKLLTTEEGLDLGDAIEDIDNKLFLTEEWRAFQ